MQGTVLGGAAPRRASSSKMAAQKAATLALSYGHGGNTARANLRSAAEDAESLSRWHHEPAGAAIALQHDHVPQVIKGLRKV